ncbi:6915_t:CDS:2, partial [Racocetra fulgida]
MRPASALYQAINAVIIPRTPPILVETDNGLGVTEVSVVKAPIVSSKKVRVKKKKRAIIPPVERKVAKNNKKVTEKANTKGVASLEFPHASQKLYETSIEQGQTKSDTWALD